MFWVISVYFNIRNTLPKSGTFLLYIYILPFICQFRVAEPFRHSNLCHQVLLLYKTMHGEGYIEVMSLENVNCKVANDSEVVCMNCSLAILTDCL